MLLGDFLLARRAGADRLYRKNQLLFSRYTNTRPVTSRLGDNQLGDTSRLIGRRCLNVLSYYLCFLLYRFTINIKPKSTARDNVSEMWNGKVKI